MREFLIIAFENFLRLSVIFALAYGLYRIARLVTSRFSARFSPDGSRETWDAVEILYRIPSGIFGFLILDYVLICIGSMIGSGSFGIHGMWSPWGIFAYGMDSAIGIVGCAVIFGSTVFGIYQDYPPTRLKILGIIGLASFVVGFSSRW